MASQNPLPITVGRTVGGVQKQGLADVQGNMGSMNGISTKLNMTAANVIKASAGRLRKIIVIAPGTTSGGWTLNDCAATGDAAASNTIWTKPYNATDNVAGAVFNVDIPCSVGITLSAVPGGGSPILAAVYD